jgi:glycosyltransferase involved in cell wall biosynthesis
VRIVVNDYLGHAAQVQLSRALAARGHDVLHIYSSAAQTPKADLRPKPGDPRRLTIEGLQGGGRSTSFLAARFCEARFGRAVASRVIAFRPDLVIACNNPLDVQRELQRACRHRNIPFVYWMQEFHAMKLDQALARKGPALSALLGSYYHWLERSLLQQSSAVVAIAHDYLAVLAQVWEVYDRQCMVVRNWAPLDAVTPGPKANAWSRSQGLADKGVVLYTGSLGPMEEPAVFPDLAQNLTARSDATVVVISEGDGAIRVEQAAKKRGLANLVVLPFQPYEVYGDVLASADVLIGSISERAGNLYAPSKVASYFCAGRPIVLAAPLQSVIAQDLRASGGGCVAPAEDRAGLSKAVLSYLDNEDLRTQAARSARRYAERAYDIGEITDRFERLFERLHDGPPRRRQTSIARAIV